MTLPMGTEGAGETPPTTRVPALIVTLFGQRYVIRGLRI